MRRWKGWNGTGGNVTKYSRDLMDRLTLITDPASNIFAYVYNLAGQRIEVRDPDLGKWTYTYDEAGRLKSQKDAPSTTATLTYDGLNRVVSKAVVNGATSETTTNTYDQTVGVNNEALATHGNKGRLTTTSRIADGTTITRRFAYDTGGRLVAERTQGPSFDKQLGYTYHPSGHVRTKVLADGTVAGPFGYDAAGRLTSIDNPNITSGSEPDHYITDMAYNPRGQVASITYGSGAKTSYTYDDVAPSAGSMFTQSPWHRGLLRQVETRTGAGEVLFRQGYIHEPSGHVASLKDGQNATFDWNYYYDSQWRLTAATSPNYTALSRTYRYDAADNMVFNSALNCGTANNIAYPDYNGSAAGQGGATNSDRSPQRPHSPSSICSSPVTYAGNGNVKTYDGDGAGTAVLSRTITYDLENRPTSVSLASAATTFVYGPDGERVRKSNAAGATWYLGNDTEVAPDGMLTSYISPDVKREGGVISWLVRDHLNSLRRQLFIGATATSNIHAMRYDPYGAPLGAAPTGANIARKGYINERYDSETRLQYLHARYYDPNLPRFLTPDTWDPTLPGVDFNRYAYAGNDPVNGMILMGIAVGDLDSRLS